MSDSLAVRSRRLVALTAAPSVVRPWGLVIGLSYGFVLSTYVDVGFVYFLFWWWALVPLVVKSPDVRRIAGVFWLLLRRTRADSPPGLLIVASTSATLMGMFGAWHLVYMFD